MNFHSPQINHLIQREPKIFERIFDESSDPMWLIVNNKFENCNQAAVRELGYADATELQNTHPSQISPEHQEDGKSSLLKAEKILRETMAIGQKRFEWTHCRKNGENFPVEVSLTKISSREEDVIFCLWRDISKRKLMNKNLIEARNNAESANRAKSKFLSMMSHELRTPLNAVLGFSELLRNEYSGPLNDKQKENVNSIYLGGKLLLHLVEDLLSMSEIEQGELKLTIQETKVVDIQKVSIAMVESLAEKHNVKLHYMSIPKHLDYVMADQLRSVQILVNLLSNAIKYNTQDGNVWLHVKTFKKFIRFSVTDDGMGIDPKYSSEIFEPFNRGDKVDSGIEGTGLGLPICSRLVSEMNGSCDFQSVYGEGSTFWIDLPAC